MSLIVLEKVNKAFQNITRNLNVDELYELDRSIHAYLEKYYREVRKRLLICEMKQEAGP